MSTKKNRGEHAPDASTGFDVKAKDTIGSLAYASFQTTPTRKTGHAQGVLGADIVATQIIPTLQENAGTQWCLREEEVYELEHFRDRHEPRHRLVVRLTPEDPN